MNSPNLAVFASGSATGGGSGFENLVISPELDANFVVVVSNHEFGGVRERADRLGVPFHYMPPPYTAEAYQTIIKHYSADWISLSGWLKMVHGLAPERTFNIHPGPLPRFGGKGMHGHHVHEAVWKAFQAGEITHSAMTMHFVDELYDHGPTILAVPVPICPEDTPDAIGARVNLEEHKWQPFATDLVIHQYIRLVNGKVVQPSWFFWPGMIAA
ncbi:MAG: formyltransferase family protein [Patescibacteria group bacterium]